MLAENGSKMFIHRCKNYTETPNLISMMVVFF
jgi:hypothetical protein